MSAWLAFVEVFRALIFAAAHVTAGSVGGAILLVSLALRVALLPYTLRMARAARDLELKRRALAPELAKLRKRHAKDSARLAEETLALHQKHGITMLPPGFGGLVAQGVVSAGLYQAIVRGVRQAGRFFWVGDLAAPDLAIALTASALAGIAAHLGTPPGGSASRTMSVLVAGGMTLFFAWRLSAGVGLYWVASNVVGVGQAIVLRVESRRAQPRQSQTSERV